MRVSDLEKKAAQIRADVLAAISHAGSGYSGSCMAVVEILLTLYYGELFGRRLVKLDPMKPGWDEQDYVILSEYFTAPVQYAILADLGFFDKSELRFLMQAGSNLTTGPSMKVPGVSLTVPAIGQGFAGALGLALALKMDRRSNKVYTVLADSELQKGRIWEVAMAAAHYKLDNLIAFIDNSAFQYDGPVRAIMDIGVVQAKFESFGWKVIQVVDGHSFDQLLDGLERAFTVSRQPVCIWCHTTKGKGVEFAEGKSGYHALPLSEPELREVLSRLNLSEKS